MKSQKSEANLIDVTRQPTHPKQIDIFIIYILTSIYWLILATKKIKLGKRKPTTCRSIVVDRVFI